MLLARADNRKNGEPLFPVWSNVRRDLEAACKRAGIEKVSPNDFRRTFATWQAEEGVPDLVTSSLMGHTSSLMVRKVYAKIGDQAKRDAMAKLSGLTPPTVVKESEPKRKAPENKKEVADSTVTDVVTNRGQKPGPQWTKIRCG